jgi:hypothetical protein
MAKSLQAKGKQKVQEEEQSRGRCKEQVVKFSDVQHLINHLEWIKFKAIKNMFSPEEVATLIKLTADYKEIKP